MGRLNKSNQSEHTGTLQMEPDEPIREHNTLVEGATGSNQRAQQLVKGGARRAGGRNEE